jgi:hypothetical protein
MANTLNLGNGNWATKKDSLLGYNSENNNYKPLPFDFSRASSATVINKDGLIETVGSGEPRIDYKDDSKGALLLEPSRSNIFDYSSNLSAWSKLNSTVTESSVLSLDGVNNSYVYERTSSSSSYIYRTVSLSNTTVYTLSFFVKSGTSTNVRTDIWDTTQSTQCEIQVDLATKTVSNFQGTSYKIEDYTNGWMRVSVTFTSESSFGTTFNRYFNVDSVGTELYIWGAQVEQGSYATSYIPTQGSAVTRLAESCSNGGNEQVINSTEGVLYAEISALDDTTSQEVAISLSEGQLGVNRLLIRMKTNGVIGIVLRVANTTQATIDSGSLDQSTSHKVAVKYKLNDIALWIDGIEVGTDNSANVFLANTLDEVSFNQGNNSNNFYGNTKDIRVYNTALSDSELAALTTI